MVVVEGVARWLTPSSTSDRGEPIAKAGWSQLRWWAA